MQVEAGTSKLIYLYAFIPTEEYEENPLPHLKGIDPQHSMECIVFDQITAITCLVKHEDFSEEVLQKKVENMGWLQDKAFHHHEKMNALHNRYTVIPLKFGTLYENEDRVKEVMDTNKEGIMAQFIKLKNQQEWNVKIYTAKKKFIEEVEVSSPEIEKKKQEIKDLPRGKQYFEKKKMSQFVENEADKEIDRFCECFHEQMTSYSKEEEVKKNWERNLTGRKDDMCWNGAYLIPKEKVEQTLAFIKKIKDDHENFTFEITGPWPAYHFSNFTERGETNGG
ncbi:GvpL/GvpF family gas vesicle protein [Thalassobacillus sp. C254]|uniref:GvpL/GvpF family gas vesicle protein n=1 Tax=Thalassobacillus sp. C254 TaxID=1225341 RepID=UPI0006D0355C|nr:GvpL/GvpF family gas vesicle protein [Thalassobacillus sp. C254]